MILLRRGPESPTPYRDQGCLGMSGSSDSGPSLGNGWRFASARERCPRLEPVSFAALPFRRSSRAASFLVGERFLAKRDDCRRVLFRRNRLASRYLSNCYFILTGSCRVEVTDNICSCGSIRRAKYRGQHRSCPLHLIGIKNDRKAQKGSQECAPQKEWSALQLENFSRGCRRLTGDRHGFFGRKIVAVWQLLGGPSIGDLEE
jgi:hypothetical protein